MFSDEHIADTNDHVGHRQWCAAGQAPDRREYYNWCPKLHVWGLIGIGVKKLVVFGTGRRKPRRILIDCILAGIECKIVGVGADNEASR